MKYRCLRASSTESRPLFVTGRRSVMSFVARSHAPPPFMSTIVKSAFLAIG